MIPLHFLRRLRTPPVHYTDEAIALFQRFAQRYQFEHVKLDAPVEVLWEFPLQTGLAFPITLGLQNLDELNFGLPGFRSFFFPFPSVAERFERYLDAWVLGKARIVHRRGRVRLTSASTLEILDNGNWQAVYKAGGEPWPHAKPIVQNSVEQG